MSDKTDPIVEMADAILLAATVDYFKTCAAVCGVEMADAEIVARIQPLAPLIHRFAHSVVIDAMVGRKLADAETPTCNN